MTATEIDLDAPRKYQGWYIPQPFGAGPFGISHLVIIFVGSLVGLLLIPTLGWQVALAWAVVVVSGVGLSIHKDRHHRTKIDKITDSLGYKGKVRRTGGLYLGNNLTKVGSQKLPGVLAPTDLYEGITEAGEPFAFIYYPDVHQYAVTWACEPEGFFGLDPAELNAQVARYGEFLAGTGAEPGLVQVAVTVETHPDGGATLAREVKRQESPLASALSKQVFTSIVKTFPENSAGSSAWMTLTFEAPKPEVNEDGTKHKVKRDGPDAIRAKLAASLPHLLEDVPDTGAGPVTLLTAQELCRVVRIAYNPDSRALYDQCDARGDEPPEMKWEHVGPSIASDKDPTRYEHSGAVSVVWEFTGTTSHQLKADALLPLLKPHQDVHTKRVTWLYAPWDPAKAGTQAELDYRNSSGRILNSKKPTAASSKHESKTDSARHSEADGAGLVDVAILVTATVPNAKDGRKAENAIAHIGPRGRLLLRRYDGCMDLAFAQGIGPLGLVTKAHTNSPSIRKAS